MDTLHYLFRFLFKFAILFFFAALVWWFVATFAPSSTLRNLFSIKNGINPLTGDWLPSPRSMKGLFAQRESPNGESNVYVPGPAYNGYGNAYKGNQGGARVDFVTYTPSGIEITHSGTVSSGSLPDGAATIGYSKKELFIRNLSMYEGGHVYTGLAFTGEAKNIMFQDGKFPIIIADMQGRVLSIAYGEATTNWTVPGWIRFQVKITGVLPNKIPCTMIFEQSKAVEQYMYTTTTATQPVRVAIPILCN